jgi:competence protein ComEA
MICPQATADGRRRLSNRSSVAGVKHPSATRTRPDSGVNQARTRLAALIRELAPETAANRDADRTLAMDGAWGTGGALRTGGALGTGDVLGTGGTDTAMELGGALGTRGADTGLGWAADAEPDPPAAPPTDPSPGTAHSGPPHPARLHPSALHATVGRAEGGWADGRTGRLVERWVPGGTRGVEGVRSLADRHRFATAVLAIVLLTVIGTVIVVSAQRPVAESAPALPAAISAAPTTGSASTTTEPTDLVISVVGRVERPGLVTLADGSRVADAIRAAGGVRPNTDDMALNLARKLADGEQIYVGVPIPAAAAVEQDTSAPGADVPLLAGAKSGKTQPGADPAIKVDLNTATDDQLETLPGIGPAMAQRILTWRAQHGHFDSIGQLRDVGGIGDARFGKLQNLVTT